MSLFKAAATVGSWTAISRILGMVREMLMTYVVGVGVVSDAFVIAFKFPNFFRRFFAEGAFHAAFVPEFSGRLSTEGREKSFAFASHIFSTMALFLCGFVLFFECFTPWIIPLIAPGFSTSEARLDLAIQFTRITFPYIFFMSLTALLGGILNTFEKFWVTSAAPILLNIAMIAALLLATQHTSDAVLTSGYFLSIAVAIAGILQLAWLYFACVRHRIIPTLTWPKINPDTKIVFQKLVPGMIGAGVMQINMLIDLQLASLLPVGALSYLYYADRLYQLPMSVFGVAMGTALLPSLSKLWRTHQKKEALNLQNKALGFVLHMNIPAAAGLILLSEPIIALLFGHGAFTPQDVLKTAPTLAAYALGLPAYVITKVLSATFFAKSDTKTPMKVAVAVIFINLALNIILMQSLQHVGLALATSLSAYIQAFILGILLHRRELFTFSKDLIYITSLSLGLTALMGGGLYALNTLLLSLWKTHIPSFIYQELCLVTISIAIGSAFYFLASYCLGGIRTIQRMAIH